MKQLFISYSRKDTEFAQRLTESFAAQNMEAWVDWQDIPPSVDWMKEIQMGIEQADIFLLIVSPDSIRSDICAQEVEHAMLNGKRMIPVIVRDVDAKEVPTAITHLNWIFFSRPQDKYGDAFEKLINAIQTDYDWVQVHRRLQVKALEWERNNRENSSLLRGKDLQDAETKLVINGGKNPLPTPLQREYIAKSHEFENEQLERQRARELQLEMEKSMGSRLRRITYLFLGVFTIAYVALFFWLNQVTSTLAINSLKDQMLALVETSVCFINGDEFDSFINAFSPKDRAVYQDRYYQNLAYFMDDVKATNENIKTQMALYTIVKGEKADEFLIVISTVKEIAYKTVKPAHDANIAQIAGMKKTVADTTIYTDPYGTWISACSPIFNSKNESIGALCADFNAQLLDDVRRNVTNTLGIAFIAIYPAMFALVLFVTRSARKAKLRV